MAEAGGGWQDEGAMSKLVDNVRSNFNDRGEELNRKWGGGVMGAKSQVCPAVPALRYLPTRI